MPDRIDAASCKRRFPLRLLQCSIALAVQAIAIPPSYAQENRAALEEILVTARFREESLLDIGTSMSALDGARIDREGLLDFEDIARRAPGVSLVDRGPNQNDVAIRGVANGVPPQTADGGNMSPLVTQYFDDIKFSSTTAAQRDIALFDLERVEVLRGPQPTLFGEGAVGGAIRYFSREPSLSGEKPISGTLNSSVETIEDGDMGYRVQGAIETTISPGVAGLRIMGFYREDGGFVDNPLLGTDNVNDFESYGGRAVFVYTPNERFKMRLSAHIQRDEPGDDWGVDPGTDPEDLQFSTAVAAERFDDLDIYAATLSYEFDKITAVSITGYNQRENRRNTFDPGNTAGVGFLYPQVSDPSVFSALDFEQEVWSQEFRFFSNFDGPLNFIAGLLYSDSDAGNVVDITSPGLEPLIADPNDLLPGSSLFTQVNPIVTEQYSAFVELTYDVTERFRAIVGARYLDQNTTSTLAANAFAGLGAPAPIPVTDFVFLFDTVLGLGTDYEFNLEEVLPRFGLEFDLSDSMLLYANAAKGIRNGGLNSPLSALGAPNGFDEAIAFEEDSVWGYEIGFKGALLDNSLNLSLALFLNEFTDPQVQFVPVATQLYANGPDSEVMGLEAELNYRFNANWSLLATGTLMDAEFVATQDLGAAGVIADGNRPAGVAEESFSLSVDYVSAPFSNGLELRGNASVQYVGDRFADPQNFAPGRMDSITLVNLRAGLFSGSWDVTLYATNLFNEIEYQALAVLNTAPGTPVITAHINQPRAFGLSATYSF